MQFYDFILRNMEPILCEWEEFARTLAPGRNLNMAQLRNDAEDILKTSSHDMALAENPEQQKTKSRGGAHLNEAAMKFANRHALGRHQDGFDLDQVVSEYRALRASVIRLWTEKMGSADIDTLYQLTRFNEALDQALTYTISKFSEKVAQTQDAITNDLRQSDQNQRKLSAELQEANRRKDEFLAILAHELRNPLTPIQNGIEVLRLNKDLASTAKYPLDVMERQTKSLVRLIDDLMDLSRIARGKISLQKDRINIKDVVNAALEAASSYIHKGQRKVEINLPKEPLMVEGDFVRLVQLVTNILTNAGKYTDYNGHIWVTAYAEDHQVRISVRDNGAGIQPDKLQDVFQMFVQVNDTHREGLGIGLSIAHKLVELHGGVIEAKSQGLGQGSEVIIQFPQLAGDFQNPVDTTQDNEISLNGLKIMIVDDKKDITESLGTLIELLGGRVYRAEDGYTALNMLEKDLPDLVFLDIGMPGMDGYELARKIRANALGKNIKLVAVTGWGQEEARLRVKEAGIDDHIVKPITSKEIKRVLEKLYPGNPGINNLQNMSDIDPTLSTANP